MTIATITGLDPLMTKKQTADYLGYSTRWVELQVKEGGLPHRRPGGKNGHLRFRRSEIDRWMEER